MKDPHASLENSPSAPMAGPFRIFEGEIRHSEERQDAERLRIKGGPKGDYTREDR